MRQNIHFILIACALLLSASCVPIAESTELFGNKSPEVGFMNTSKAQLINNLGEAPTSPSRVFYERKSDYKHGADSTKSKTVEVIRYDGQTAYEAHRLYVMVDGLLCATAIVFNTNTTEFTGILNDYLSRYFRIDFDYILRVGGMDVEPADLDEDHQYLLGMFQSDMFLSKTQPSEEADTFDKWINSMIGYSMIIRSEFPYRTGSGNYSLLTYLDVNSIKELVKIYDRLGFVDYVLEQVPLE